jgi:hypothetical protein
MPVIGPRQTVAMGRIRTIATTLAVGALAAGSGCGNGAEEGTGSFCDEALRVAQGPDETETDVLDRLVAAAPDDIEADLVTLRDYVSERDGEAAAGDAGDAAEGALDDPEIEAVATRVFTYLATECDLGDDADAGADGVDTGG